MGSSGSLKVSTHRIGSGSARINKSTTPPPTMSTAITAPIMETVETGIEYFLPTDAPHWIPNGFVKVTLKVNAAALADDFYATLEEAAEQWADANLGAGVFSQVIMEP